MGPSTAKDIVKPMLRGRFHEAAAYISLGGCAMLLVRSTTPMMALAVGIYSIALICLLTISATYHRIQWQPQARALMRRLDHAAIFGLIGGTMTPIFLLALPPEMGRGPLLVIWLVIALGILQTIFWIHAPKWLASLLYVAVGWIPIFYFAEIGAALGVMNIALIVAGGIVYTLGALIYALKKPNPWPWFFGYHEIFHIAVVIAAILHFCVIYNLITLFERAG